MVLARGKYIMGVVPNHAQRISIKKELQRPTPAYNMSQPTMYSFATIMVKSARSLEFSVRPRVSLSVDGIQPVQKKARGKWIVRFVTFEWIVGRVEERRNVKEKEEAKDSIRDSRGANEEYEKVKLASRSLCEDPPSKDQTLQRQRSEKSAKKKKEKKDVNFAKAIVGAIVE